MINKKIVDFEYGLTREINEAQLPPAVISLVLIKLLNNVNELTYETINREMQELNDEKYAEQEKTEDEE